MCIYVYIYIYYFSFYCSWCDVLQDFINLINVDVDVDMQETSSVVDVRFEDGASGRVQASNFVLSTVSILMSYFP